MSGPVRPPLTVETVDGTTVGRPITKIKVSNGTLTVSGSTATVTTGGGGGGSMTSFDVAGNTGATQTIGNADTFTLVGGSSGADIKVTMSATDTATIDLQTTGVTAASYTYASITVDDKGRITAASSGTPPAVDGSGASTQVTYWQDADTLTGSANLTFDGTNLTVGGYVKSGGIYDTSGATDLTLKTNGGTDSGTLTLKAGSGGNLVFDPTGAGLLQIEGTTNPGAIKLMCEAGTHGITIESAPHASAATYKLVLPGALPADADNKYLVSDTSGNMSFTSAGGGGTPGGSDGQIQYNNGGSFGGSSVMTFDDTASAEQVLFSGTSSQAIFKVEQQGAGNSIEVHDAASDTTIFLVDQFGRAAIKTNTVSSGYDLTVGGSAFIQGSVKLSTVGTTSAPAITWDADTTTGINKPSSGEIAIVSAGTETFRFGANNDLEIAGNAGTAGQVFTSGGAGASATWTTPSGGGSVAGSDTQIQFNDGGAFGASDRFLFDPTVSGGSLSGMAIKSNGSAFVSTSFVIYAEGNLYVQSQVFGNEFLCSSTSVGDVGFGPQADQDTGVAFTAADQVDLVVGGSLGLSVDSNKAVLVGGASGTAGQVLTSGGSGAATTWADAGGVGLNAVSWPGDDYSGTDRTSNLYSQMNQKYSVSMSDSGYNPSSTDVRYWPYFASNDGDITKIQVRSGSAVAGTDCIVGFYNAGTDGLPTSLIGSATFDMSTTGNKSQTSFSSTITTVRGRLYYIGVVFTGSGSMRGPTQKYLLPIQANMGNDRNSCVGQTGSSGSLPASFDKTAASLQEINGPPSILISW